MEKVEFTKYHGIGNDFVLIDCCHETRNESLAGGRLLSPEQCIRLCDRHRGIGADGVIFVQDDLPVSNGSEFVMVIINSDGSRAKMCGNGLRCFAKYLHSKLQSQPVSRSFRIWTDSGERIAEVGADGQVSVDMGVPQLRAHLIPTLLAANSGLACVNVDLQQPNLQVTCVNMGNPHAVIFNLREYNFEQLGRQIAGHECFPEGVNVGFAEVLSETHISLRVWERGAGATLACGTGACAAVVAGILTGHLRHRHAQYRVSLPGGDLLIRWSEAEEQDSTGGVTMIGPAEFVFKGEVWI